MSTYRVDLGFDSFIFKFDSSEASRQVEVCWSPEDEDEAWSVTPYLTADARHDADRMARMLVASCGTDYYAAPDDDRDPDIILREILAAAKITVVA